MYYVLYIIFFKNEFFKRKQLQLKMSQNFMLSENLKVSGFNFVKNTRVSVVLACLATRHIDAVVSGDELKVNGVAVKIEPNAYGRFDQYGEP